MKTRTRLTLLFTLVTATILWVFAFIIYVSAKDSREKEFYSVLEKEAITKANLFFTSNINASTLQDIYKSNRKTLNEVEVAIYDSSFQLFYHDAIDIDLVKETPQMIQDIHQYGKKEFYQEKWQVLGLPYQFKNKTYIITAIAFDEYGYNKLDNLYQTIVLVFVLSILVVFISGWFFSKKAFSPIIAMIEKAKSISVNNLDLRLSIQNSKDELSELASTFNGMLDRLEGSFEAQKNFVSNISHEIRTPLAAIITELDLSLNKERDIEAYKLAIKNALSDSRKLAKLSNNLLDLAKASYDPSEISFKTIRIDEVLLDAMQAVQKSNPNYEVKIDFKNNLESDHQSSIYGNEYLLKTAFINLIENACKFSDNQKSEISISFGKKEIQLQFSDQGLGIDPKDIQHIYTPFYRGENKNYIDGNGIGLPLTKRIIDLHSGRLSLNSTLGKGSTFTVFLRNLEQF